MALQHEFNVKTQEVTITDVPLTIDNTIIVGKTEKEKLLELLNDVDIQTKIKSIKTI